MNLVLSVICPRLLMAATDEPQTPRELLDTLKAQGTPLYASESGLHKGLLSLTRRGCLERSGHGIRGAPFRYARTALGAQKLAALKELL